MLDEIGMPIAKPMKPRKSRNVYAFTWRPVTEAGQTLVH
jgi:hypothetical protein